MKENECRFAETLFSGTYSLTFVAHQSYVSWQDWSTNCERTVNGGSGSIPAILWIHPPLCGLARRLFLCSYGLASGWILREWWKLPVFLSSSWSTPITYSFINTNIIVDHELEERQFRHSLYIFFSYWPRTELHSLLRSRCAGPGQ